MAKLENYGKFILDQTYDLLQIDSPTGYTRNCAEYVKKTFNDMGYKADITRKGGVMVDLGGKDAKNAVLLEAHMDTLGGMVCEITGNGRLKVTNLGGMNANNAEGENVRVITKFDGIYEGTLQLENASIHVNGEYNDIKRSWNSVEVVLDELVKTAEDVKKLGISVGDIVAFEPRTRITEKGFIKSRFLDDKLSVGILMGFAKFLKDEKIETDRKIFLHITSYEEVGHGGSGSVPEGITEAISVDMGCVGRGLTCTETEVSICAKDSGGPYDYSLVTELIESAKKMQAAFAVDVYPHYGSDVEATLRAGYDVRHGLIGSGVYASHGYERSHRDGAVNTLKVLVGMYAAPKVQKKPVVKKTVKQASAGKKTAKKSAK